MSESEEKEQNIRVIIRIKARTPDEINKVYSSMKVYESNMISIISKKKKYFYDYIGDENATQNDIFEQCGKKICDYALEGYNGTIFAYGQTGSGKTYTLLGKNITNKLENKNNNISDNFNTTSEDVDMSDINDNYYNINDEKIGLLPRILHYLFENRPLLKEENKILFKISYMEIYKEALKDLLDPDNKNNLQISDANGVLVIKNLRKLIIDSPKEAIKLIIDGNRSRHTASTLMNKESSRSHAIISIYIENNLIKENKIKKSVFHIIDLAGSERQKKTGTNCAGDRMKEAESINTSLLNLSRVILSIINKEKHIPYRDSKLTHILKDSLGGNAKTSIIATISQLESNIEETISTLNFAQNAKKIVNNAIVNEEISENDAKMIKEQFKNLKIRFDSLYLKCGQLEKELQNQRKSICDKENISKSLEVQNEDISRMMDDIFKKEEELKKLKEENEGLKDKIDKNDITFKLKDVEIEIIKKNLNNLNNEKKKISEENIDLKNKIKNLEDDIIRNNEKIKILNDMHKKEISEFENNCKNLENKNLSNDSALNELKEKIKQYEEKLNSMNFELAKSKKKLEEKEANLKTANSLISEKVIENKLLNNSINFYKNEINSKKKELEELNKNNLEIKTKGKDIINKYNEVLSKNSKELIKGKEEIKLLNESLLEKNKKIEKIDIVIKQMENENQLLKDKIAKSQKTISEYLDTITLLHQQNITFEKEKKEVLFQKEQLEKKISYMFEPFSNSLNKSLTLNTSYTGNNSKEHLQLKKEHEILKRNYEELIKNIEPNKDINISKIKKIQDLSDKLTLFTKELNDYKISIRNMIKKIGEKININISSNNDKEKGDLKNKLESVIILMIDNLNNKTAEIKILNDQKEILLNNIKTNNLKKDLLDFLNTKANMNKEEIDKKDLSEKINKMREEYQAKNYENKSQKRQMLVNYDLLANKENNNILNFSQVNKRK